MFRPKLFLFVAFVMFPCVMAAQETFEDAYNDFKKKAQKNYEDFRRKANHEYAEWMRKA